MYFETEEDVYYIVIEQNTIYRLVRNYEWEEELITGEDVYFGTLFSNYDIDEIVSSLRKNYSIVERIDESEIDEYI